MFQGCLHIHVRQLDRGSIVSEVLRNGWGPITRRSFPREAFPRDDAQWYVSARESQRAETYHCASSRGNASRGKDRGAFV